MYAAYLYIITWENVATLEIWNMYCVLPCKDVIISSMQIHVHVTPHLYRL